LAFQEQSIAAQHGNDRGPSESISFSLLDHKGLNALRKDYLGVAKQNPQGSIQCLVHVTPLNAVFCGDGSGYLSVWDDRDRSLICEHELHSGSIFSLLFYGDKVWTTGRDNRLCVWSLQV
jgi:hypothetical protein